MVALYLKELKSLLRSFYGWAFFAVMTFFASIYLVGNNFYTGNPYISWTLSSFLIIPMFVLPLLTMRSYSEEKKQKTDQLLLTSPLSIWDIVFGKFFAVSTLVFASVIVYFLCFFILMIYGEVPVAENLLAMLAFYLYCLICVLIGLLISALTEHQFLAAIMTYVVYLAVLLVPSIMHTVFPDKWFTKTIDAFDFINRFTNMFNGMILMSDVIYILTVFGVLLLLTYYVVGRFSFRMLRNAKQRFLVNLFVVFGGILLFVGINIGVMNTKIYNVQFDFTKRQLYSISEETEKILDELEEEVVIYVIGDESSVDQAVVLYTADYARNSSKIKIVYKSDVTEPLFYQKYSQDALSTSSMIVEFPEKQIHKIVNYEDCYEYQYIDGQFTTTAVDIEGQITAAITALQNGEINAIYELVGHNEVGLLDQSIISRLTKGGYEYNTLNLMETPEIPENADCIIVSGPIYDLGKDEINLLLEFSVGGGDLILFASHPSCDTPNYNAFIELFGVTVLNDYVCDTDFTHIYQSHPNYIWGERQYHGLTAELDSSRMNLFPETRGFILPEDSGENYLLEDLFRSSSTSLTNTELGVLSGEDMGVTAEELPDGPYSLAFCATPMNEGMGSVLVIGSAYFLLDKVDEACAYANSEFALGVISDFVDSGLKVTIPAKSFAYPTVVVPTAMILLFGIVLTLVVPMVFVAVGLVITIVRRKR